METEKLHIIPHQHQIQSEDRKDLMGHKGMVIWFVGLSGSGKSTLASVLERRLYEQGKHTYILDGDNIRSGLNSDLDFSDQSRVENIRRISEVAKLMVDAGLIVLTAFITPFEEERQKVKNLIGPENYFEIFVNCPSDEFDERDPIVLRTDDITGFRGN